MRVIGVDPGSRITGWAVVEREGRSTRRIASGVVRTDPTDPMPKRLLAIHSGLAVVIAEHAPDAGAIEEIFAHRSAASALVLGHARGVALLALAGLSVSTYNAASIKKSVTGSGKADKAQIARVVAMTLGLVGRVLPDETDAIAIALTHLAHAPLVGLLAAKPLRSPRRVSARDTWAQIAQHAARRAT
jgi:crossover junction endodeoxyribonuclease RuvC